MIKKVKDVIFEWVENFITSIIVLFSIYLVIAFPVIVDGQSMSPNLSSGDRLLIEKITPKFMGYERGDIVVIHPPKMDYIDYIKRVVALPGERVKIINCKIQIITENSEGKVEKYILDESKYLSEEVCTAGGPFLREGWEYKLGQDEYLVLGDNRANSSDSRYFGFVKLDRFQGKLVASFWPFDKIRLY